MSKKSAVETYSIKHPAPRLLVPQLHVEKSEEEIDRLWEYNRMMGRVPTSLQEAQDAQEGKR